MGLELIESSPYALAFKDGDNSLRVQIVDGFTAAAHTVHGWHVTNIKAEVSALRSKGVVFEMFDRLDQSPEGVWSSPSGAKIAWFKDPSGNLLSLTQFA